jgi:hypothetical protein
MPKVKGNENDKGKENPTSKGTAKVHTVGYSADYQKIAPASQAIKKKAKAGPPPPTTPKNKPKNATPVEDDHEDWQERAEFKEMVKSCVVPATDSEYEGWRQCHHCHLNKKEKDWVKVKMTGDAWLECGCKTDKAVCEQLLVNRGILGKGVGDATWMRSLTAKEWFKMDHIMGSLFGFNTSWLMEKKDMIAGLKAKLAELEEEAED